MTASESAEIQRQAKAFPIILILSTELELCRELRPSHIGQ